ncbi:hypothetical protein GALL_510040 [mine drainage metagenome]|uniref:Uncharacterized protein n=1 Tax=mine drainage metagenome TaxID=410659 RepID=A0A1J5P881_9ZZZZ
MAAVDRSRIVHRPDRDRRHQRSLVHLCQPLVRPQARLGAGADLERHLSRRRDVAAGIRAGDRQFRLAAGDAVVCPRRDHCRRAAGRDLFSRATRSDSSGGVRSQLKQSACPRLAAQCRVRGDVRRRGAVLHSHGDAAGPPGRLLQRSRYQPVDGRPDAVGTARHRVPEPTNLGRDLRSYRRSFYRTDRIGLAGRIDDGLPADTE